MKTYELSFIVSPEISSEEATAKASSIESAIQSREGIILKQSIPTAKTLAYPIGKRASGFFGVIEFQIESDKLLEVKEIVAKDKQIVRHMLIVKEPIRIRKERRSKRKTADILIANETTPGVETKSEEIVEEKPAKEVEKVELKDIEQKLEELLG